MKISICFLLLMLSLYPLLAQPFQIHGTVRDGASGDLLPYAHIYVKPDGLGVVCNDYGFFSLSTKSKSVELKVSFTGYEPLFIQLNLTKDTSMVIDLHSNNQIAEVKIRSEVRNPHENLVRQSFTGRQLEKIPTLMGEKDVVKALQLMPGIKMGKEGSTGMHVRGGTPGQNLILLDGVPVYNVDHLFGFFSVFTPEAVKRVDVYKGAFPANYGGRISSVLDVKMREGNLYEPHADITIGTLSSKLVVETPIAKGKSSVLLAARYSNFDLYLNPFLNANNGYDTQEKTAYRFADFNAKFFFNLGTYGNLYWSTYTGFDNLSTHSQTNTIRKFESGMIKGYTDDSKTGYAWGNRTTSVRWNKSFGAKLFVNATALYSKYQFNETYDDKLFVVQPDSNQTIVAFRKTSKVTDLGAYVDFDYFQSKRNHVVFGVHYIHHVFTPSNKSIRYQESSGFRFSDQKEYDVPAPELNAYAEDRLTFAGGLQVAGGLHYARFRVREKTFESVQPRVRATYDLGTWLLKSSAGYMVQPMHNLIDNSNNRSASMWMPSEGPIVPSTSIQVDWGATWFRNSTYSFEVETYWRTMNNIISRTSREPFFILNENWYDRIATGQGKAYGIEVAAHKKEGKTTGMIGYTWSKSIQQFEKLNQGRPFAAPFERRHAVSIVANHQFSKKLSVSGNWVFATGEPITLSTTSYPGSSIYGRYTILDVSSGERFQNGLVFPGQILYVSNLNNYRMPAYHRLDVSIDFRTAKKKGIRTWSVSAYNAYARNNPYMYNLEFDETGNMIFKNTTFFKLVPSISYRYEF